MFDDGFGPWRSMSVYLLMLPHSLVKRTIFPFPFSKAQLKVDRPFGKVAVSRLVISIRNGQIFFISYLKDLHHKIRKKPLNAA